MQTHPLRTLITATLITIIALVLYLPGLFTLPAIDRDESRFAQASRQMAESGDIVVPMVQGKPRLNKPPLIYWLQSASATALTGGQITRDAIWMYRIPSWLAAAGTVVLVWHLGRKMFGERAGLLAASMFAVAPVILWEARQARADTVLVFVTTGAMVALWHVITAWSESKKHNIIFPVLAVVMFWVCIGLGIMTKGPVTPLIVACTLASVILMTRARGLGMFTAPLLGAVVVLGMGLPWLLAVMNSVGADVYIKTIYDETLGRSLEPKEGHSGPPGYHTLLMPAIFFPGSLALGAGIMLGVDAIRTAWRERRGAPEVNITPALYLVAWILPAWIVFEFVRTKLPHYTMPLYPALALLCAGGLVRGGERLRLMVTRWWAKLGHTSWALALCTLIAASTAVAAIAVSGSGAGPLAALAVPERNITFNVNSPPAFLPQYLGVAGWLVVITGALIVMIAAVVVTLLRGRPAHAVPVGCALFGLSSCVLIGSAPSLERIWTTRQIVTLLHEVDPESTRKLGAVGYHEDSLIFATRGRATRINPESVIDFVTQNPGALLIVDDAVIDKVPLEITPLGSVTGYNYSKGKWTYITLGEHKP